MVDSLQAVGRILLYGGGINVLIILSQAMRNSGASGERYDGYTQAEFAGMPLVLGLVAYALALLVKWISA